MTTETQTNTEHQINKVKTTFAELYEYLRTQTNIEDFLETKNKWIGKEKQESLLRLFTILKLVSLPYDCVMCYGNYNTGDITQTQMTDETFRDFFKGCVKDSGSCADIVCINEQSKKMIVCSAKNRDTDAVGKFAIDPINTVHEAYYASYDLIYWFLVRDKIELAKHVKASHKTSKLWKDIIEIPSTIIHDRSDLINFHHKFLEVYGKIPLSELPAFTSKPPMCLRFHQELAVKKNT